MHNFSLSCRNMVSNQIAPNVHNAEDLLTAMSEVPRHLFIPETLAGIAYMDEDVPINSQRFLQRPALFAKLVELVAPTTDDVVLDIACGTGYSTAIFSHLVQKVIAVEPNPDLASAANNLLHNLTIKNAIIITNSIKTGHPEGKPYDIIFVNGLIESIPENLTDQLAENGRLIAIVDSPSNAPIGRFNRFGKVVLLQKNNKKLSERIVFTTSTYPLLTE